MGKKKSLESPLRIAAKRYMQEKLSYMTALVAIETISEAHTRRWAKEALTARVRGKFGNIGRGLTKTIGCHFSALPNDHLQPIEFEHAIPLNLIHNRILGLTYGGEPIAGWIDEYSTLEQIETFLHRFLVGVKVTPQQHRALKKKDMPPHWNWLSDWPEWDWNEVSAINWHFPARPTWLTSLMGRYEDVAAPHGPIEYMPLR